MPSHKNIDLQGDRNFLDEPREEFLNGLGNAIPRGVSDVTEGAGWPVLGSEFLQHDRGVAAPEPAPADLPVGGIGLSLSGIHRRLILKPSLST